MSDLAYNIQGERFQVPADASMWRVRRFKRSSGRGMPEVVFGDDGLPLTLPIDIDVDEFRRQVGGVAGKYRLDPIDANQQACDGGQPAYVQFQEAAVARTTGASSVAAPADPMLREVIAANTEMVRAIADKFAQVMESAAVLLRAADGAGLPAREPAQPVVPSSAPGTDADEDGDEDADDAHPLTMMLNPLIKQAMPLINHTVNTKVLGLTHEQSIALLGGTPATTATPPAAPSPASASVAASEPGAGTTPTPPPSEVSGSSTAPSSAGDVRTFSEHMVAVQGLLSADETALVIAAVKQMTPDGLTAWRQKLLAMSPEDAAAAIRAEIQKGTTSDDQ